MAEIPNNYTQIDYIQSDGNQWIDTGINANLTSTYKPDDYMNFMQAEIKFSTLDVSGETNQTFFGAETMLDKYRMEWLRTTKGSAKVTADNNINITFDMPLTAGEQVIFKQEYLPETDQWQVTLGDDVQTVSFDSAVRNTQGLNWYVFGRNNVGSADCLSKMRLYYFKMYRMDGTQVRDFIPCVDKYGIPCLFDRVSGESFYNRGTGDFTYSGQDSLRFKFKRIIGRLRAKKVLSDDTVKMNELADTVAGRNIAVTQLDGIEDDDTVIYHTDGRADVLKCQQLQCTGDTTISAVVLGDKVTDLMPMSFTDCSSLESIEFDQNLTAMNGARMFQNCTNLKSVDLPSGFKSIGWIVKGDKFSNYYTFQNCTSLSSVSLGDSIADIPDYTFTNCSALLSIRIPASVTYLGVKAFGMDSLNYNAQLSCVEFDQTVNSQLTNIAKSCFDFCINLSTIQLPPNLQEIHNGTFWQCKNLISLDFQEAFSRIPDANTFGGCTHLSTIILRNRTDVVTLGTALAFNGTYSNYVVYVPDEMLTNYIADGQDNWKTLYATGHLSCLSDLN